MHKQSLVSKGTSAIALLIGFSPVITDAKETLLVGNTTEFGNRMLENYTGFDVTGGFDMRRLYKGYGPLVAAIAFKKVTGYLLKHAKLKI